MENFIGCSETPIETNFDVCSTEYETEKEQKTPIQKFIDDFFEEAEYRNSFATNKVSFKRKDNFIVSENATIEVHHVYSNNEASAVIYTNGILYGCIKTAHELLYLIVMLYFGLKKEVNFPTWNEIE